MRTRFINFTALAFLSACALLLGCGPERGGICYGNGVTFLEMGDIVGDWDPLEKPPQNGSEPLVRFDEEGHLQTDLLFGCAADMLPLVLHESNSKRTGPAQVHDGWITFEDMQIGPGHFRLTYDYDGKPLEIHGKLLTADQLQITTASGKDLLPLLHRWPDETSTQDTSGSTQSTSADDSTPDSTTSTGSGTTTETATTSQSLAPR